MLQIQCVILDSWQDAGNRRLTRAVAFNGDKYTVSGLPTPSRGGPTTGDIGTLVFLPGEGEYAHAVIAVVFTAVTGEERTALLTSAKPAEALPKREVQATVLTPEQAKELATARAARRLANNPLVGASLDASQVPV